MKTKFTLPLVMATAVLLLMAAACKEKECPCDTPQPAPVTQQRESPDLGSMSLNQLIEGYSNDDNKDVRADYLSEIRNIHEVCHNEYKPWHENFWKPKTPEIFTLDKTALESLLNPATNDQYLQFTFTPDKKDDFSYYVVSKHAFNSYVSCFSVLLLKDLLDDTNLARISITKGYQNLPGDPTGHYIVAMLVVEYNGSPTRYFDIVRDPTITGAHPPKECAN